MHRPARDHPKTPAPRAIQRPARATDPPASGAAPQNRMLRSEELLAGAREVTILHGPDAYRLRLTSNDKLILTK